MNVGHYELERQSLLTRLLDATKECQVRFGGKTELATEVDSRVSCLCSVWESALQHGLRHSNRALSTLKQVTEKAGLTKMKGLGIIQDLSNMETEPVFWYYVREHLNKQELQRYHFLGQINTDAGRGRAWLRSTFNEHSLERYLHMLLEDTALMRQYYEDWAFLLDQEKASMTPSMAAGLNSILFAISIDNPDLNTIKNATGFDNFFTPDPVKPQGFARAEDEPRPVIAGDSSPQGNNPNPTFISSDRRKLKKKRKKPAHLVSFDEDDLGSSYSGSPASSVTSPRSPSEAGQMPQDAVAVMAGERPAQTGFFGASTGDQSLQQAKQEKCSTGPGGVAPSDVSSTSGESAGLPPSGVLSTGVMSASVPSAGTHSGSNVPGTRRLEERPASPSELRTGAGTLPEMTQSYPGASETERPFLSDITSPTLNRLADLQNLIDNTQSSISDEPDACACVRSTPSEENLKILDRNAGWRDGDKTVVTTQIGKVVEEEDEDMKLLSSHPAENAAKGHKRSVSEGFASLFMNCSAVKSRHDPHSITDQDRSMSLENHLQKETLPQQNIPVAFGSQDWKTRLMGKVDSTPPPNQQAMSRWDSFTSNDSADFTSVASVASASSYETLSHSRNSSQDYSNRPESLRMFMTPVSPEGTPMVDDPATAEDARSTTSSDALSYLEDTSHASLAMSLAESSSKYSDIFRTQGDGSHTPEPAIFSPETLTTVELKQAIVDMMVRKDEVEEYSRRLKEDVNEEKERSVALQLEFEEYRRSTQQSHDRDADRIKALTKENELLKHQLKKYVSAVQMLRSQNGNMSADVGVKSEALAIPPPRTTIDYSHEASEYERKLIQVAEMHGELMEFNEVLHRQLNVKETQLHRLRQELITLRGPLPEDLQGSDDSFSPNAETDSLHAARPLVNIWVPSVFLKGSPAEAHHVYQVFIRIKDEEWTVYRRYSEFYELHVKLKKKAPIVNTFSFPPKKALGNKDPKFVEERRKKLQQYLRQIIQLQQQLHPELSSGVSKGKLMKALPFLSDQPLAEHKKGKGRVRKSKHRNAPQVNEGPASNTYMGF